jgi:hypothetical protein
MDARSDKDFAYGVSGYVIVRDTEQEAQAELARILDVQSDPAAYASYQDFVAGSQLSRRSRWRSTPSPTAGCGPAWSAHPSRSSRGSGSTRRPAST